MEALKLGLNLDMAHVPFRGTGQSVPALLGGHVETLFSAYPSLAGAVEGKTIKLLATNGAARSAQADVPPIADVVPGFDFAVIVGVLARAGTPQAIIQRVSSEAAAVVALPEVQRQFAAAGIEPAAASSDEFGRAMAAESERVKKVIDGAHIKVE
jgi:tripartite-type tricarboxylate transporter receptor subunit TctC